MSKPTKPKDRRTPLAKARDEFIKQEGIPDDDSYLWNRVAGSWLAGAVWGQAHPERAHYCPCLDSAVFALQAIARGKHQTGDRELARAELEFLGEPHSGARKRQKNQFPRGGPPGPDQP